MKTQSLNVDLSAELRRYVKDQVRAGRYQNENEVVTDAIRQMQQREIEQFERLFGEYPGAPQGEPTTEDDEAIKSALTATALPRTQARRHNHCRPRHEHCRERDILAQKHGPALPGGSG
jgi:putative addiction module CopG family antidote